MKTKEELRKQFDVHVNNLLVNQGIDVKILLLAQVGPYDAETILNQMFAFYTVGYIEGMQCK